MQVGLDPIKAAQTQPITVEGSAFNAGKYPRDQYGHFQLTISGLSMPFSKA